MLLLYYQDNYKKIKNLNYFKVALNQNNQNIKFKTSFILVEDIATVHTNNGQLSKSYQLALVTIIPDYQYSFNSRNYRIKTDSRQIKTLYAYQFTKIQCSTHYDLCYKQLQEFNAQDKIANIFLLQTIQNQSKYGIKQPKSSKEIKIEEENSNNNKFQPKSLSIYSRQSTVMYQYFSFLFDKGFQKRPIGVQAPQFSGTCLINGGYSQKSLRDFNGKYLVILFYSLEDQLTYGELINFDNMYEQFQSRNCDIIIIIDDKIDRIKHQLNAHINKPKQIQEIQQTGGQTALPGFTNSQASQGEGVLKFCVFGDPEGKIFNNFKVPTTDSNKCYRYKAVYLLDKLGIIQYLNIYNSNIRCDPNQVIQLLTDISDTPLSKQLSLFERVGGSRVLIEAVELFYNNLPNNPFLDEFFKNLNYRNMKIKQAEYLNYLFHLPIGGQKDLKIFTQMNGKNISDSHKGFIVPPNIYEIYVRTFCKIFGRLDVDQNTTQEIYERFQLIKPMIFPNLVHQKSTYELLGSTQDSITLFVDILFGKVLVDDQIGSFFKGIDMNKLKQTQKSFFSHAFGGPSTYDTKKLIDSHQHLRLNDHHFEAFIDYICESLTQMSIPPDQVQPISKQFQSIRNIFVANSNPQIQENSAYNTLLQSSLYHSQHKQDTFQQTLYYRIGGKQVVDQFLATFQQRILADPRVNYIFKSDQAINQMDMYEQLLLAMGGQIKQKNIKGSGFSNQKGLESQSSQIQSGRMPVKMTEVQFSQMKQHLLNSARTFSIDFEKVVEIGQIYESLRGIAFYIIPQKTIYEQFGGENGVLSSVNIFYDKIQFDHRLNILFKTIPVQKQKEMFYNLISFCVGSPNQQLLQFNGNSFLKYPNNIINRYDSSKMKQQTFELHMRDIHLEGLEQNLISTLRDMMQSDKDIMNSIHLLQTIKKDLIIPIGTLLDEIGGELVIDQAIQRFYLKLLNHDHLKNMFKYLEKDNQINKLRSFIIQLFGGPEKFTIYFLIQSSVIKEGTCNKHMVIQEYQTLNLINLKELGGKMDIIPKISYKLETLRKDIVDRNQSIFERLGGERLLNIVVDLFYQKVLRDERVNFFFQKLDMNHQKQMMKHFLSMMLGGDQNYKGKSMKEAHQHLELNNLHFDVIKAILMDTLIELDIDYSLIDKIENDIIEPLRKEIIIHVQSPNYNYF